MQDAIGEAIAAAIMAPAIPSPHKVNYDHVRAPPPLQVSNLSSQASGQIHQAAWVECLAQDNQMSMDGHAAFGGLAKRMRYSKAELLFRQNDIDQYVHLLIKGVVCEHRSLADGRRLISRFALPGDFIGLWGDRGLGSAAEALGPVSTCRISRDAFAHFLDASPHLWPRMQSAADRESALGYDRMMLLGRYTVREKVAAFFILMLDRWHRVSGRTAYLPLPMTRQDIGDFLAIRLETASRMIGIFAREGLLIVVPGGVRLLDLPRIRLIAQAAKRA